jgi:hypothetical protein
MAHSSSLRLAMYGSSRNKGMPPLEKYNLYFDAGK